MSLNKVFAEAPRRMYLYQGQFGEGVGSGCYVQSFPGHRLGQCPWLGAQVRQVGAATTLAQAVLFWGGGNRASPSRGW